MICFMSHCHRIPGTRDGETEAALQSSQAGQSRCRRDGLAPHFGLQRHPIRHGDNHPRARHISSQGRQLRHPDGHAEPSEVQEGRRLLHQHSGPDEQLQRAGPGRVREEHQGRRTGRRFGRSGWREEHARR